MVDVVQWVCVEMKCGLKEIDKGNGIAEMVVLFYGLGFLVCGGRPLLRVYAANQSLLLQLESSKS